MRFTDFGYIFRALKEKNGFLQQNGKYGWIMLPLYNNAGNCLEKQTPSHALNYSLEYTDMAENDQAKLSGRNVLGNDTVF